MLSRDDILSAKDLPVEKVDVPEWSGHVFVRCMTGRERDEFESSITGSKTGKTNLSDFRAKFAAMVICDESGKRIFSNDDIIVLSEKSGAALDRIFDAGKKLNRIGEQEQRELVENFD